MEICNACPSVTQIVRFDTNRTGFNDVFVQAQAHQHVTSDTIPERRTKTGRIGEVQNDDGRCGDLGVGASPLLTVDTLSTGAIFRVDIIRTAER